MGLNVGSAVAKPVPPRVITCPRTLEFRQLLQHKPLTTEQRQQVVKAMTTYGKYLQTRQKQLESLLPEDPRDESEKMIAEELASRVGAFYCIFYCTLHFSLMSRGIEN